MKIYVLLLLAKQLLCGLSTTLSEINLKDLKIGNTYSLYRLTGKKFSVTYTGKGLSEVNIYIEKPADSIPPDFHPLPDTGWIRIVKSYFILDPHQSAETDILISIPEDKSLLGKKFIVHILPQSLPYTPLPVPGGVVVGLRLLCKLTFSISDEISHENKKLGTTPQVIVYPDVIKITKLPSTEKIKIQNLSLEKARAVLSIKLPSSVNLTIPHGYNEPELKYIKVKKKKLSIKPGKTGETFITIKNSTGQNKYYFLVFVDVKAELQERYCIRVFVEP